MTSFGETGKIITDFGGYDSISNVIFQDGKIVVAGYGSNPSSFILARYNSDGTLDASFGTNGTVISTAGFFSNSMIVQDSKLVVAGSSSGNFALARYSAEGELDTSFGTNGLVVTDFGGFDVGSSVTVQDGKLIISGYSSSSRNSGNFALARYSAEGELDTSFGTNGLVVTDFGGFDVGYSVIVQDGKLLVVGGSSIDGGSINGQSNFVLVRYSADGELDTSFGNNDRVGDGLDVGYSVIVQDGKLLVVGDSSIEGESRSALVRYSADGELDTSFGNNGIVITDLNGYGHATSIIVQDGKLLVVGTRDTDFALTRYSANGELDTSFGTNGIVITDFGSIDSSASATVQEDGKIIVAGASAQRNNSNFAIARYNSDGSLDANFLPISADKSVSTAPIAPYSFSTSDFSFIDANGDTFEKVQITSLSQVGILFLDRDGNDQADEGETITLNQEIAVADLGKLKFKLPDNIPAEASFGFKVNDGTSYSAKAYQMSIESIEVTPVNAPPTAIALSGSSVDENAAGTVIGDVTVTDPDSNSFEFTLSDDRFEVVDGKLKLKDGIGFNFEASMSIDLTITASDRGSPIGTKSETFTIGINNLNDAPTLTGTPPTSVDQDKPYSFKPIGADEDSDTLIYSVNTKPEWATFNEQTGELSGTPTSTDTTTGIVISVSDTKTTTSLAAFDLLVNPVNNPPTISGSPQTTVDEDSDYSFTPIASDLEGGPLTFSINKPVPWATFNPTTGTLSGTPNQAAIGTTTGIIISVSDGESTKELPAFDLTVNGVNDLPTVANAIADQAAQAGTAFSYTVPSQTFQDVDDGDTLTLIATLADGTALPAWLSFNATTGNLTGTPPQAGSIAIKVTATDRADALASDEFNLAIAAAPSTTTPSTTTPGITTPGTTNPGTTNPGITPDLSSGQPSVLPTTVFGKITQRINGTGKADRINGSTANDFINGKRQNDRIDGGAGDDIVRGNKGNDRINGGVGNDRINGSQGNDRLLGGTGDDRLVGGLGKDTLTGGAGNDVFEFNNPLASQVDMIADFDHSSDLIDVRGMFAKAGFADASLSQVIRLEQVGANTEIKLNVDGLVAGTSFATIARLQNVTATSITASSFVIR